MGGTSSKSEINQLTETISNIAMTNITKCQSSSNQNQNVVIRNTGFRLWTNYKIKQTSTIDSTCAQDTAMQAKLQNDIIAAIGNKSTAEGIAFLSAFGNTRSEATTNLTNRVRNNVTMSNIMTHYNNISQSQNIESVNEFIWLFDNLEAVQGSEIFAAATLQSVQDADILNQIKTYIDQTSKAKEENPMQWIADIVGGMAQAVLLVVLFIILIIIAMIWAVRGGASRGGAYESDILVHIKG